MICKLFSETHFRDVYNDLNYTEKAYYDNANKSTEALFDVFLSYNINDQVVVKGIYYSLRKKGFSVYLDSIIDPHLRRENCNKATALLLHKRLLNSRSLIYASSANASQSKWMAWELGVVDGNRRKCFILPVSNDFHVDFVRKEFLQIYPLIKVDEYNRWMMEMPDNSYSDFRL